MRKLTQKIRSQIRLHALGLRYPKIASSIRRVKQDNLTYLNFHELLNLTNIALRIEKQKIPGAFIEAGCARGGSAIVIAASKQDERAFFVYDTFEMIPPPSDTDGEDAHKRYEVIAAHQSNGIQSSTYYGYIENLYEVVQNTFLEFGYPPQEKSIHLVKGLFENTITIDGCVALAHLDCDWYDSVMVCLQRIEPHLSVGGTIIIDDYFHWSGSKKAVDDYFTPEKRANYTFTPSSHLLITRIK
jgi:asparagine synthase (glutamine-hydrolysing)